jgi:hypothetical protein
LQGARPIGPVSRSDGDDFPGHIDKLVSCEAAVVRDVATPVSRGGVLHDLTSPPRDLTSLPLDVTSSPLISVRSAYIDIPMSIYIMYHLTCFQHDRCVSLGYGRRPKDC